MTRQSSCLLPQKELSISITYLLQSPLTMPKFLSNSAKNLGFTLGYHLNTSVHVFIIAQICYFKLHHLSSINRFPTNTATATLVSDCVLSRIDYCNSLLFGSSHDVTSHLQRIWNYAPGVILVIAK